MLSHHPNFSEFVCCCQTYRRIQAAWYSGQQNVFSTCRKYHYPFFFGFKIVVDPVARILKSCINKNNVSVRIVPCVLLVKSINGCGCIKVAHLWKYGYTVEGVSDWYMNGFYFFFYFLSIIPLFQSPLALAHLRLNEIQASRSLQQQSLQTHSEGAVRDWSCVFNIFFIFSNTYLICW